MDGFLKIKLEFYEKEIKQSEKEMKILLVAMILSIFVIGFSVYVNRVAHSSWWKYLGTPLFLSSVNCQNYSRYKSLRKKRDEMKTELLIES
jgi:hypothetical protein